MKIGGVPAPRTGRETLSGANHHALPMNKLKLKRLSIKHMDQGLKNQIDEFNDAFHGTIYHETWFNEVSAEFFGTDLDYFLAFLDGELVGICPCHSLRKGMIISSYSNLTHHDLPYGGWVYNHIRVSLEQLLKNTRLRANEALQISSNIELSPDTPYKAVAIIPVTNAKTVVVELAGRDDEDLFNSFKHSQKNKIRKAAKLGVEIRQSGPEGIAEFHELLAELKSKVGKSFSPKDYFTRIFNHYHGQGKAMCFLARYEEVSISTLIMLANKTFATIWMGGRKMNIPKNLYQNELMIWEAIKWGRSIGCNFFDLCVVNEARYPNLSRMKLSFSHDVRHYYFYSIKKFPFRVLNKTQNLFGITRQADEE